MKQKEIVILTDDELKDKLDAFQKNLHDLKLTLMLFHPLRTLFKLEI
mgnify:CR=1 FL=1